MITMFLGKPVSYWVEIQKGIEVADTGALVDEIVELRGRCSFYEKRIKDMHMAMERGASNGK